MKKRGLQIVLREIVWGVVIIAVCAGLITAVLKNYVEYEYRFKALPYQVQGYPQGEVLLIGSSTMEYWTSSEADLGPLHTINVGVAGSKVQDLRNHISELVEPFHPRAIVLFIGSNDIDGSENSKSGEEVAVEMGLLFEEIQEALPDTPIYCIAIAPTPERWGVWNEAAECNRRVREMAEKDEWLHVIDCASVLLDEEGQPDSRYYRPDNLHFTEEGYARWTTVVRPTLLTDLYVGGEAE